MTGTAAVATSAGVVWTDTRDMEWERFGGFDAGRVKPLHVDERGHPMVMLVWLPPGDLGLRLPHRHLHRTVYECAYHLGGDLPHAEWSDLDALQDVVVFREGFYLNRAPGSMHGNEWIFSDTGAFILFWRSGTGNWLDDPDAPTETPNLDPEGPFRRRTWADALPARWGDGVVLDRPDLRILSTREMAWRPVPDVPAARVRVLARDAAGEPTVRMIFLPPGDAIVPDLPRNGVDREFAYVIEGELPVAGRDGLTVCRQGYFMNRSPDARGGLQPAAPSTTGAVALHWRVGPDTFVPPR